MKAFLQSFGILTDEEIESFLASISLKKLKKGDFFIREGKVSREVGFVSSGFLRSFYHNSAGEEITYCFRFEGAFVSAFTSFLSQTPTTESIQALMDVEVYVISRDQLLKLQESSLNWLKFFKYQTEQEYMEMEKRVFLLQKESAEKRYEDLLTNYPSYLQQIPLNYLSSYLGITQRHLSRIRKALTN